MEGSDCHSSCGNQRGPSASHRIQVQEELAHDRHQGNLARFASLPQALIEVLVDALLLLDGTRLPGLREVILALGLCAAKGNEITALPCLLDRMVLEGVIVQALQAAGADYVWPSSAISPMCKQQLFRFLTTPLPSCFRRKQPPMPNAGISTPCEERLCYLHAIGYGRPMQGCKAA